MIQDNYGESQDNFITKNEALFFAKKWNIALMKNYLVMLEDLRKEHEIIFKKLKETLPKQYQDVVNAGDYFGEDKYSYYRKKTLDNANSCFRNLENDIDDI